MAGISAEYFASKVKQVCSESDLVVRVAVITESHHQVKLWIFLKDRTVIAAYYNDENRKTGFALLRENLRVFGADNANGVWHWHPFENPASHVRSETEITFEEFLARLEEFIKRANQNLGR